MKKLIVSFVMVSFIVSSFVGSAFASASFKDVPSSHWAAQSIQTAVENGIVNGYTDGTFKPNQEVKEAEFLAMLLRAYKPADKRAALPGERWSNPYYEFASDMNYPVKQIGVINRKYVAEMISATQGVHLYADQAIQYVLDQNLASGKVVGDKSIKSFDGEGTLTRAEAVAFVMRAVKNGQPTLVKRPLFPETSAIKTPDGKPVPKLDRFAAVKEMAENAKGFLNSLGYDDIQNYSGTVVALNNKIGVTGGIEYHYIGMDFESFGYFDDFQISVRDFNMKDDKNSRIALEYLLNEYGFDTEKADLMERLIKLDDTRYEVWEEQGYRLTIFKNYIPGYGVTSLGITFKILY